MTKKGREFDIIVYGATSFVGQILIEYLTHYTAKITARYNNEAITWAIAGRNEKKLLALKNKHNINDIAHFIVEASNFEGLSLLSRKTKVIITTVGPYALYGEMMVKACVTNGTDYCDLTGEPQWIRAMLDKYEEQAKASGARIINSAGFDSIPSDIGVYALQKIAVEKTGKPAGQIKMRVRKVKGAASGGTIASMLNIFKEAKENPTLRKLLTNPYALCTSGHSYKVRQKSHKKAEFDKSLKMWTMPFVMAAINERIVHRTNSLLSDQYGTGFRYDEAMSAKTGFQAWTFTIGLGGFMLAASVSPVRNLMAKHVLAKPGEGPSEDEQLNGMFDMRFYSQLANGEELVIKVEGDRDPGYGSTAKMLSQAALCLANDVPDVAGGFWTPASALNDHLIKRLKEHAGVSVTQL
ncbi:saccharopine dehydrogenase [Glaciecola punicea]|uniref:saccharopine dehydrogenase family protein n=1 Tax=Glaciecola punicea TaxID=56804 RepID=UPI0008732D18|nr:saccharopine dehydrogenase NADP-binding domain-containing protein [Glaciecola punicea]OFA31040.1 saccharopine dehydrogenase [Glaciecola punicea]